MIQVCEFFSTCVLPTDNQNYPWLFITHATHTHPRVTYTTCPCNTIDFEPSYEKISSSKFMCRGIKMNPWIYPWIYMFSFSLTINLDIAFSWAHVSFLSTSFTCFLWIMCSGEFISKVLVDKGERVTSFNSCTFFPGNSSFGWVDFCFFFFTRTVSVSSERIYHRQVGIILSCLCTFTNQNTKLLPKMRTALFTTHSLFILLFFFQRDLCEYIQRYVCERPCPSHARSSRVKGSRSKSGWWWCHLNIPNQRNILTE